MSTMRPTDLACQSEIHLATFSARSSPESLHNGYEVGYRLCVGDELRYVFPFQLDFLREALDLEAGPQRPRGVLPWQLVRGGELDHPIAVRFGRSNESRPIITGLLIGFGDDDESPDGDVQFDSRARFAITAEFLRKIKPASIVAGVVEAANTENYSARAIFGEVAENAPAVDVALPRSPGRRGHGPDFYRQLADKIRAVRADNPTASIELIAEKLGYHPSHLWRLRKKAIALGELKEGE